MSSAGPKVSVVIPVYNTEGYVQETIESICSQTLRDIEIIAIDDGSTDRSLQIMEGMAAADGRIRVLSQENRGLSLTRNRGIVEARGEYIYFMDSDDLLDADTLELCYEKCRTKQLDAVIFDAVVFGEVGQHGFNVDYLRCHLIEDKVYTGEELLTALLAVKGYRASACLYFTRTEYMRSLALGFYPRILHEDELFTPQLFLPAKRVGRIDRAFFHRRMRGGSIMTSAPSSRSMESYQIVLDGLKAYSKGKPAEQRQILLQLRKMIQHVLAWNAAAMPFDVRMELLGWTIKGHMPMISLKSYIRLAIGKRNKPHGHS